MKFTIQQTILKTFQQFGGATLFYTCLPLPSNWPLDCVRIARWAPWIGLLIGAMLGGLDLILAEFQIPNLTRCALVVLAWVWITGGLHLDGVIDTADGLAVPDSDRRLEVMADSRTGAFGVMAAIALLLLKTTALTDLTNYRWLGLMLAGTWGRWAQVWAIACYPYLKPEGKGAFHKQHLQLPWDLLPGAISLIGLSIAEYFLTSWSVPLIPITLLMGSSLIWTINTWHDRQLQGMTGDTYGAIVEWVEAFMLCFLTAL